MNWLADTVAITGTVLGVFSIGTFMTGWWHLTPYVLMMSGALLLAGGALGMLAVGRRPK